MLRFCKERYMKLLVYHGTLAWDLTCSSSVMYPHLSGYCSFSQCQLYLLQCQFAIHSSLKGNRLPHLSPVLADSFAHLALSMALGVLGLQWQLKDWRTAVKSTGLAFLVTRPPPMKYLWRQWQSISQWLCSQAGQGFLMTPPSTVGPFLWASSQSGSVSQWSHYSVGSLVMMWYVWYQDL